MSKEKTIEDTRKEISIKMKDQKKGYMLLHRFLADLTQTYKRNFVYIVTGSLKKGGYIHNKSDIDLCLIPQRGAAGSKWLWNLNEFSRKYGEIKKKGRMIGVFDILIFFDAKMQKMWRKAIFRLIRKHGKQKWCGVVKYARN